MSTRPEPGSLFDDRYEILDLIGEGGMGCVYRAREIDLERVVALKLLDVDWFVEEGFARFDREARVVSRLSHENIVSFYRLGMWQGKVPYLVMEYVDGESLRQVLNERVRLDWRQVVDLGIQLSAALEYAHGAGVIHRDIKPSNLLLCQETGLIKVADFGLARVVSGEVHLQRLTQTGALVGSVDYMSPEQCRGQQADQRSDIYGLGCVLYECLCGSRPFEADSSVGVLFKHVNEAPALATRRAPQAGIPPALDHVVLHALEKSADSRYQSAADLAAALKLVQSNNYSDALPATGLPAKVRPLLWVACAVVPLVLLAGLAIYHNGRGQFPVVAVFKDSAGVTYPLKEDLELDWLLRRLKQPAELRKYLERWLEVYGSKADPFDVAAARIQMMDGYFSPETFPFSPLTSADPTEFTEAQLETTLAALNPGARQRQTRKWLKNQVLVTFWKGLILEHMLRPADARAMFQKVIDEQAALPGTFHFHRWVVWAHLAHVEAALGHKEQARNLWREAVRRSEGKPAGELLAPCRYAQYLIGLGELAEARIYLSKALAYVVPGNRNSGYHPDSLCYLITLITASGDKELGRRCLQLYRGCVLDRPDWTSRQRYYTDHLRFLISTRQADELYRVGMEAIADATSAGDTREQSVVFACLAVQGLLKEGRISQAESILARCRELELSPEAATTLRLANGMILNAKGDHAVAQRECADLVSRLQQSRLRHPDVEAGALAEATIAALKLKRVEDARRYVNLLRHMAASRRDLLNLPTLYLESMVRLAMALQQCERWADAQAVIRAGLDDAAGYHTPAVWRSRQAFLRLEVARLLRFGESKSALMIATQVVSEAKDPEDRALGLLELGRVLIRRGEISAARESIQKALQLSSTLGRAADCEAEARRMLSSLESTSGRR